MDFSGILRFLRYRVIQSHTESYIVIQSHEESYKVIQSVLAIETIEKANSCEPFIEVDDTLNKLKDSDVIQDILDNDDEYLIL